MYCKVQMGKDSEEDVFFNSEITSLQKLLDLITLNFSSFRLSILNLRVWEKGKPFQV